MFSLYICHYLDMPRLITDPLKIFLGIAKLQVAQVAEYLIDFSRTVFFSSSINNTFKLRLISASDYTVISFNLDCLSLLIHFSA